MTSKVLIRKSVNEWLEWMEHHGTVGDDIHLMIGVDLLDAMGYTGPEPTTMEQCQIVINMMILKMVVSL